MLMTGLKFQIPTILYTAGSCEVAAMNCERSCLALEADPISLSKVKSG